MKVGFLKAILYVAIVSSLTACSGGSGSNDSVDTISPSVTLNPASGDTLSLTGSVTLDFSEAIILSDIILTGDMERRGVLTQFDADTLKLSPKEKWEEGKVLSLLINAKDTAGNRMQEVTANYQIEAVAPELVSISPAGERLEKGGTITVQFSETMNQESLQLTGSLTVDAYDLVWLEGSRVNDTLRISPKKGWISGKDRTFALEVEDSVGNKLSNFEASFTVPLYFKNFDAAQVVVGQEDFSSTVSGLNEKNIAEYPIGSVAVSDNGKLFISDTGNNRVLGYNEIPKVNGAPANFVLGQEDLYSAVSNNDSTLTKGYGKPTRVSISKNKLLVTQAFIRRSFLYDEVPEDGEASPHLALGLRDGDGDTCNSSEFSFLESSIVVNGKIIAADTGNSRILIWDELPNEHEAPANLVLGQSSFNHCLANDDKQDGSSSATTARTLSQPNDIWSDGEKLAVVDTLNNRVLLWNTFPKSNFVPADVVLGQKNFSVNQGGSGTGDAADWPVTNKTFNEPYLGIWSNGLQLFLVDGVNHRVLIWDQWPENNFAAADWVIGQSDFEKNAFNDTDQNGTNNQGELPSASTLKWPEGVVGYQDKLFVTDSGNNRILIFKSR
ncbi:Ig-like domain-containing protein [uncultured Microbulbifer sp.]|uniref:Ig-like domain-containing protein n=1 Tax=uncultured Microbulbifer sp. TaxID=348147 RepID=UPI00262D68E5|nr:Ig-like domain-containing protein [uncultured Microbulbifer sp.]